MSHSVRLSPLAVEDLIALEAWIAGETDAAIVVSYITRIEQKIRALSNYPDRGTPREELAPGLRTLTFERNLIIAYRVQGHEVLVLRIISGRRELSSLFAV